jgi:predicted nucleic acid-binding protein
MAKIFLDANVFIDFIEERKDSVSIEGFNKDTLFISALSLHILLYITKQKIPVTKLSQIINLFSVTSVNESVCQDALLGPTDDFEDNVQLHSAAAVECDSFLTRDKKLLALHFFGKMSIVSEIQN